jgi:glucosamine--fructose-6-phosphate aminotransferase (isomerizing)
VPSTINAHPHSSSDEIALVHNGIIENHDELREELQTAGYSFSSETDSEVVVHLVHSLVSRGNDLFSAVRKAVKRLRGAYAIAVISAGEPGVIVGARAGSPMVLGIGFHEHFLASDIHPLLPVTNRFVYLEEGDVARLDTGGYEIRDCKRKFSSSRLWWLTRWMDGSVPIRCCRTYLAWAPMKSCNRCAMSTL